MKRTKTGRVGYYSKQTSNGQASYLIIPSDGKDIRHFTSWQSALEYKDLIENGTSESAAPPAVTEAGASDSKSGDVLLESDSGQMFIGIQEQEEKPEKKRNESTEFGKFTL